MKHFFWLAALLSLSLSAQTTFPRQMAHGYITLVNNQKIEFRNLRTNGDEIVFLNVETKSEFHYFPSAVREIEDENHQRVYVVQPANTVAMPIPQAQPDTAVTAPPQEAGHKLEIISASNIRMNGKKLTPDEVKAALASHPDALSLYTRGQNGKTVGDIMLGAGIGLIVGGAIANLSATSTTDEYGQTSSHGAGPAPIIIGLAAAVISIPIKTSARDNIMEAVSDYNRGIQRQKVAFSVVSRGNGIGLRLTF